MPLSSSCRSNSFGLTYRGASLHFDLESHLEIVEILGSLDEIASDEWNALTDGNPFVSYQFLHQLHVSGCASAQTGWSPCYLILRRHEKVVGAMLLYKKYHSRGEYVFDHAWAQAYAHHGLQYYPKMLSAVPFTAVTGPRLLAVNEADKRKLVQAALQFAGASDISSLHFLFPSAGDLDVLTKCGFMLREGVQFHWVNHKYESFEHFLAAMSRDKRKKIKQDHRRVADAGVTFRRVTGTDIQFADMEFFYKCYALTYDSHFSTPYLSKAFFEEIRITMGASLVLILAEQGGIPIAAALNFVGPEAMYGRYWGTTSFISGLHFELCYMQAISYCIDMSIPIFEGGAQGEHKLSRGLEATPTWSAHWIADERFEHAIHEFLKEEGAHMNQYIDELSERSPFKPRLV